VLLSDRLGRWPDGRDRADGKLVEQWGFPARAAGRPGWVRISRGIVIPWLLDGQLWQLKVRTNRQQPKYLAISGGYPCLFGAETLVPGESALSPALPVATGGLRRGSRRQQGRRAARPALATYAAHSAVVGKDVTAVWQAGGRVRGWLRFDLARRQLLRVGATAIRGLQIAS
jgi:hypothetical protein